MGSEPRDVGEASASVAFPTVKERCDGRIRTATLRVTEAGIIEALGAGWLGKGLVGGVAALAAWFARRPTEQALMMSRVDARVQMLLDASELARAKAVEQAERALARCDAVEKLHADERARCDAELAAMRIEIASLMAGPVAGYVTLMRAAPSQG